MLSVYNQRINNQLIDICLSQPEEIQVKETHSFFSTIIDYWNHILFGDLILLRRLATNKIANLSLEDFSELPVPKSPNDVFHEDLTNIKTLREQVDQILVQFCEDLRESDCEKFITYTTTEGTLMTKAVADVTQHIFNHQAHHRGQLTCVLSQFGIDYGCMDLPFIVTEGSRA